ncbi:hypothetical protein LZC95_44475 [Pendulispora brunnea]|uniref:Uncharacterized protein n=1 Tax=Pendulispora brunnea TaxID=2905690 RepID=A0ABZ2K469_9BACT
MRRFVLPMVIPAVAIAWGCDKRERPPHQESPSGAADPVSPERIARILGKDAAAFVVPEEPPPNAGDLKGDLERFTTLDACVAERTAAVDPVVGDALLGIGYDTFVRDACRVLDATKARDARRCAPIEASSLRLRCEAFVAMAAGAPDACPPDVAGDRTRGRDATCVAIAARDGRLCAGETPAKRGACEALASGDEKKCDEADRRTCARSASRWKTMLAGASASPAPALPAAKGTLTLHGAEGTADPPQAVTDLSIEVERGIVLTRELGQVRWRVGSLQELGSVPHSVSPGARPRIGFELSLLRDAPGDAKVERLELDIPGGITIVAPSVRSSLKAHVTKLEKRRGGEAHFVVEGTVGSTPRTYAVHVEVTTFVRDL